MHMPSGPVRYIVDRITRPLRHLIAAEQSRYERWVTSEYTKRNPVGRLAFADAWRSGQDNVRPNFNIEKHSHMHLVSAFVYSAQTAIARDVAATPILVQRRRIVNGMQEWQEVDNGPLWELFQHPQPYESWRHICEKWTLGTLGAGNGYLVFDSMDSELYCIPSEWVTGTVDRGTGKLIGYQAARAGITVDFENDDIIHAKLPNPTGEYFGIAPTQVIEKAIITKLRLNSFLHSYFANNAQLGTILSTDQALLPEQREELIQAFKRLHSGDENAFRVAALSHGMTATQAVIGLKDLVPDAIERIIREETLAVYHMPPIKLGIMDGASYANANKQDEMYERGTVDPLRCMNEDALNLQHVWPRYGPDWRVLCDRRDVRGLQEDQTAVSARTVAEYRGGIIMLNEARQSVGRDPVDEGDEFYSQPMPAWPMAGDDDNAPPKSAAQLLTLGPGRVEKKHDVRLIRQEQRIAARVRQYFDGQLQRILDKLNEMSDKSMFRSSLGLYLLKTDLPPEDLRFHLFNLTEEDAALVSHMRPSFRDATRSAGEDAMSELGLSIDFTVETPEVRQMLATCENRITFINTTTFDDYIRPLLQDAYEGGATVQDVASGIADLYREWTDTKLENYRSMRIARTETNALVSGGQNYAAIQAEQQLSVQINQVWIATNDAATRMTHAMAHNQSKRPGQLFMVGGAQLEFPGDPSGPAEETINCRCGMAEQLITS